MSAGPAPSPTSDRPSLGIACVLVAVGFFSVADAIAKWLGQDYAPLQIVFLRYLFGLIPVALFVWRGGGLAALHTRHPWQHGLRALLILGALLFFFTALTVLPLAEAIAIAFTAPLFITALSVPILGERVGARRWAAVAIGFVGALIMVRPGTAAFQPEALLVLGSTLCFAFAMLLTRHLAKSESSVALLAYTNVIAGLVSLLFVPLVWHTPASGDWWLFLLIGLVGSTAAFFVILAYSHAPVSVVAPFEYTGLIWGALLGWIVWREQPDSAVWVGAIVIALSGSYIARREAKAGAALRKTATR